MKTNWLVGSVFLAGAMVLRAQTNDLSAVLRQGLFEEEANRNLGAAISNYQALAAQFDENRPIAATAIFRLGECYRKFGQTNDAVVQYQRIIREFPDQQTLATLSQQNLTGLGVTSQPHFQQRLQAIIAKNPQDSAAPTTDSEDLEIRRIQQMIQNSPDLINARPSGFDFTPLGDAARQGQIKVATFLLDHGADINVKQRDGETALHSAVRAGNRAMVELLLSRGAEVNATADDGQTPLCLAVDKGFQAVTEVLLANKAEVNVSDKNEGNTPLHLAAKSGQVKILQMLLAAGANPNADNKRGRTPLSFAAGNGSSESVKLLLAAKADPNGGKLDAPLLGAIHKQEVASVELLLHAGANPNNKRAVDSQIASSVKNYSQSTPLFLAVSGNQLPMVQLLLKFKADPNDSQTDGQPLLFSALASPDILKALLDAGGKVDSHLSEGMTLLDQAVKRNSPRAVVEILLKHGADPNAQDLHGNTPLHFAVWCWGSADWKTNIELLLDHRADPNVRDGYGKTPLDYVKTRLVSANTASAEKTSLSEMTVLLRSHGALDDLPHWDRIAVSRPDANFSFTVFCKGTNDWNRFTLLEAILDYYNSSQTVSIPQGNNTWAGYSASSMMPFPNLARITIVRPRHDSTNETRITVNLLNETNGIDCSKNLPLEFGDTVEIPERDHSLGDNMGGLTEGQRSAVVNYLQGSVRLVVHRQEVEIPLYPGGDRPTVRVVLNQPEAQKFLLSSSDLSRVKVIRRDRKSGKKSEWLLDCSYSRSSNASPIVPLSYQWRNENNSPSTDLRLHDGDVIEVPEKPN